MEKKYFNGIFEMNNLAEGILYGLRGVEIYEGLFINNNPKEVKNIKYYISKGDL